MCSTGRGEKIVVDFYSENLGWEEDIGQREPINCKTVGSHPLRGQSKTTDAAVRFLPQLYAVFLPDLQQQIRQDSKTSWVRRGEYRNAKSINGREREKRKEWESKGHI